MSQSQQHEVVARIPHRLAQRNPDATALIFGARATSYAELDARSSRVAQGLLALGVRPGDRVAILAKDSDEVIELIFGIAKARAVFLGINWRLAPPEVRFILDDAGATALFVGREFHGVAAELTPELPQLAHVVALTGKHEGWPEYRSWRDAQPTRNPELGGGPEDIVAQMYTSGTTGNPKGVQLPNRSFFAIMRELERAGDPWIGWSDADVALHNLPSFHIQGLWWMITTLNSGAELVIMEQWVARQALQLIEGERVTKAFFVPAMIQMMLLEPDCARTNFGSMTQLLYGGAPMAAALLARSVKTLRCPHVQIYGMTETGNTATCLRADEHDLDSPRTRSAGRPYPGVRIKVVDSEGTELPPRQTGEICVLSPANMVGYWRREEATRKTLVDGWVHTGDAGFLDEDGYVYICDRIKDMIIYAGENVYPAEVEAALCAHPDIADIAVFGVPDERWGELVHAVVVARSGATVALSELQQFARSRLAEFKIPRSIAFANALPRTSSGKVQKGKLRASHWEDQARQI